MRLLLAAALLIPAIARAADPAQLPFEKDIEAFEAADRAHMPPQGAALFVGSSSIRFWTSLDRDFPGIPTINRGFGGSHMGECALYADRIVTPYRPRVIVFYAGDNDIPNGRSPQAILSDFQAFVAKVRGPLPEVPILFISIKPSLDRWKLVDRIRETNSLIRGYAQSADKIIYVDVFGAMLGDDGRPRKELFRGDGLHLNSAGYALWTQILAPVLKNYFPAPAR